MNRDRNRITGNEGTIATKRGRKSRSKDVTPGIAFSFVTTQVTGRRAQSRGKLIHLFILDIRSEPFHFVFRCNCKTEIAPKIVRFAK